MSFSKSEIIFFIWFFKSSMKVIFNFEKIVGDEFSNKTASFISFSNKILRRNFSLVVHYSFKFIRCSLLVVKSLVTRCKIRSLLDAEVARCKKSLVTCWKSCSLLVAEVVRCNKSLVTRCKIRSLLVADVARCKN